MALATLTGAVAGLAAPPVAIYRTGANQMTGQQYATTQYTAPQNVTFADNPVSIHDGAGGTYTMVRDTGNWFWLNKFVPGSGWQGWVNTGGNGTGRAAMALAGDGTLYIVLRASDSRYYLARRTTAGTVEGWYLLGVNQFSIDPSFAGPDQSGAYHVVGGDSGNLWRGFYYPQPNFWSSTFQGWMAMGATGQSGKPGLVMGTDGRSYLFFRSPIDGSAFSGATWMAKITPTTFDGWWLAPNSLGPMYGEPTVAVSPADNRVYVASRDGVNRWFYAMATQGAGNTWFTYWSDTGGILPEGDLGVGNDGLYLAGRSEAGLVWWWQQTQVYNGWLLNGSGATGKVTTSPDVSAAGSEDALAAALCSNPPTVYAGGSALECGVYWNNAPSGFSHLSFNSCRIGGTNPDPALSVTILGQPQSSSTVLALRMQATRAGTIGQHIVECYTPNANPGRWIRLWTDLRVSCNPIIDGVRFNGQNTNVYVVDSIISSNANSFEINGFCFSGIPVGTTSSVRIGDAPLNVQSATSTQITGRGWGSGAVFMTGVRQLAVGTATYGVFGTRLTVTRVAFKTSYKITRDVPGAVMPAAPNPPVWTESPAVSDPAAYPRGTGFAVDVTITASPSPPSAVPGVRLEGAISGLGKLAKSGVTIGAASTTTVTDVSSDFTLPTQTKFYNPMTANWSISADGAACGSNCAAAGTSSNEVYVLLENLVAGGVVRG